jgi:hypothetical protein
MENSDKPLNPIEPVPSRTSDAKDADAANALSQPAEGDEPGSVAYQFGVSPEDHPEAWSLTPPESLTIGGGPAPLIVLSSTSSSRSLPTTASPQRGAAAAAPGANPVPDLPPPTQPIKAEFVAGAAKQFFINYWEAAKAVCISPNLFFAQMPTTGGWVAPTKFLAVSATGYFFMQCIFNSGNTMIAFFETVFSMLLLAVLARGVHYILQQFGGKGTIEGTYRVLAYSSPPLILMGCPWALPFALVYMTMLWFLGLKKVHALKGDMKA